MSAAAPTAVADRFDQDVDRVTELVIRSLAPKVRERIASLVQSGASLADVEARVEPLSEQMITPLPRPLVAAGVSGPVWTTEQVRAALGVNDRRISRQAVDDRVRRRTLLALKVQEAGERAYPLWQFHRAAGRWRVLPGLSDVLKVLPETVVDGWTLASWLQQPTPELRDEAPLTLLVRGESKPVREAALRAAERWSR